MAEPPSLRSGSAFWTVKSVALHVDVEDSVETIFADLAKRSELADSGVSELDVNCAGIVPDHLEEMVEIGKVRHVASNPARLAPNRGDRGLKRAGP